VYVLSCQLLTIGHAVLCGPSKSLLMVIVAPTTGFAGLVAGSASTERAAAALSDKRVTCYGTSVVSGLSASIIHMPSTEASVVPGLREI
jgi:hypothetical protein